MVVVDRVTIDWAVSVEFGYEVGFLRSEGRWNSLLWFG